MQKSAEFSFDSHLPFRVLRPREAEQHYDQMLYKVDGRLACIARLSWTLRWDLPPRVSFAVQVVPSAYTNFTCMPEGARVTGVTRGLYDYEVKGSGVIIGIMFRPGGIAAFHPAPKQLVDRFVPAHEVFPGVDDAFNRRVIASPDEDALAMMNDRVIARLPDPDPDIDLVNRIIKRAQESDGITVRAVAQEFAMSLRKMQGLFERYVGVGVKWIILRDRLQRATLLADTEVNPDWSQIAYDLGYSDQSHFINDFKRIIGMSPRQYALGRRAQTR